MKRENQSVGLRLRRPFAPRIDFPARPPAIPARLVIKAGTRRERAPIQSTPDEGVVVKPVGVGRYPEPCLWTRGEERVGGLRRNRSAWQSSSENSPRSVASPRAK